MLQVWSQAVDTVERYRDQPPTHFVPLLRELGRLDAEREDVRILDHGCGSGASLLFLMALGYRQIYGVDLGGPGPALNRLLAELYGEQDPRFFHYDGSSLPLADDSVDFVFSQQVLEHVGPSLLSRYYSEEARVLRPGGLAYHQVPHRLTPYDTHTRTWFVHYMPRGMADAGYRMLGRDADWVNDHLFLRWPWVHRRLASRFIGSTKDTTTTRLSLSLDYGSYEGPRRIRKGIDVAFRLPIIGHVAKLALGWLAMRDTVSVRRAER